MSRAVWIAAAMVALTAPPASAGEVLRVTPGDSLRQVSERLASDPAVSEVVLAGGIYRQSLVVPALKNADPAAHPLIIRPAEGASVVFDGATGIPSPRPVKGHPGVFSIDFRVEGREPPRFWEPEARVRYSLAADRDAVAFFPATYFVDGGKVYFHTADGLAPGDSSILTGALDHGVLVLRPYVTVRGLEFRNFVARGKSSAAVHLRADHVTVVGCGVANASFGFAASAHHDVLLDCTVRDVGGGAYFTGDDGRVEGCRFFKERDAFMVPSYFQDDTGIQFYHPARGGVIRRNLVAGFEIGILIKASRAPWLVEQNTIVGAGLKTGFLATDWDPGEIFRQNIVAGFERPMQIPATADRQGLGHNCYSLRDPPGNAGHTGRAMAGAAVVDDPRFVDPAADDYRLDPASDCLEAVAGGLAIGALPIATAGTTSARPPRDWHVSPSGRDGAAGTAAAPLRTTQVAVDRAGPGDTILLHPGLYPDPIRITRGGSEGRPLTIRAAKKWTAILDSNRRVDVMVAVDNAPFVAIRDLEIRWYRSTGISISDSPDATVSGCRIWNAVWDGMWPGGTGVNVENSPRFTGDRNFVFSQERAFRLLRSPRATITHNTAVANLYGGAEFIDSIDGSVLRDNSFAFQGNDALVIVETDAGKRLLATFDCDYNNYGMTLRDQPEGTIYDRLVPRDADRHLLVPSKAIVAYTEGSGELQRFVTMAAWRDFSALDGHSIFADPLYVSTSSRDFRLEPGSPNIGAGSGGATIGAHD